MDKILTIYFFIKNYMPSDRAVYMSCENQYLYFFRLTELGILNKKCGNITVNISNSLNSEKNDESCGNQYLEFFYLTELDVSNKKCGKHSLKCLQFLEIWKNDKSCGNQYFENICLTELGIPKKKCGKLAYSLKSEKITSLVETNTQKKFVWSSWVYQTKSVENITWKICNFLKPEKITSLNESNT